MPCSRFFTSQMCLLTLFAKIKFSRKNSMESEVVCSLATKKILLKVYLAGCLKMVAMVTGMCRSAIINYNVKLLFCKTH